MADFLFEYTATYGDAPPADIAHRSKRWRKLRTDLGNARPGQWIHYTVTVGERTAEAVDRVEKLFRSAIYQAASRLDFRNQGYRAKTLINKAPVKGVLDVWVVKEQITE